MKPKARGASKVSPQQVVFELKHKVSLALNKLADRDTCQIGVDELEKTAECLSPDRISPFLSCILDTDSENKSAVRKECVRLMGTLATFHGALLCPFLTKMVGSVVKRLKDPDSVVRDACVETMGVLASKLTNLPDDGSETFVALVKPHFEALGEQTRQVQSGAALCLARVIDNTNDPPAPLLQKILMRTIKLLKNPHFMAKPAVIELNRSIIQAGGATTQNILSAAISTVQDTLKSSDWTTRKAASAALAELAANVGSILGPFRASCIRSLESCRFDKVKPVRETVLHALQYWKTLLGPETPEPSEAGSSMKENLCGGDYSDITINSDCEWNDVTHKTTSKNLPREKRPLFHKKSSQDYVESHHNLKDDWQVEIAVPKTHIVSGRNHRNEESEGSSVTKTLERMPTDALSMQDMRFEYVPMDDKQEYASVCNLGSDNARRKTFSQIHADGCLVQPLGRSQQFSAEEMSNEEDEICSAQVQDRRSLSSTITESNAQMVIGCCSQMAHEMAVIQKQLKEMEDKQSNLMETLQVFQTGVMKSLSILQTKVSSLEHVTENISHCLIQSGRPTNLESSRFMKQNQGISSHRLSTCTPRPSIESHNGQQCFSWGKKSVIREEKAISQSRLSTSARHSTDMWSDHAKASRNVVGKDNCKVSMQIAEGVRKLDAASNPASLPGVRARKNNPDSENGFWEHVKGFLCEGDLDSAYAEALSSNNELLLIELLDRTGPVLESVSQNTRCDIISSLCSYLLEQRFLDSIIPWLNQVVNLCTTLGPNRVINSSSARRRLLLALQDAANMDFPNPAEKRSVTQLAIKLRQAWGNAPSYQ